jgi:hypothetical protein
MKHTTPYNNSSAADQPTCLRRQRLAEHRGERRRNIAERPQLLVLRAHSALRAASEWCKEDCKHHERVLACVERAEAAALRTVAISARSMSCARFINRSCGPLKKRICHSRSAASCEQHRARHTVDTAAQGYSIRRCSVELLTDPSPAGLLRFS